MALLGKSLFLTCGKGFLGLCKILALWSTLLREPTHGLEAADKWMRVTVTRLHPTNDLQDQQLVM